MDMKKEKLFYIFKRGYSLLYHFVFVCYFGMFLGTLGMFAWFIAYLISGISGTALYYFVLVILVCFSIVLVRIGIIEVFKKYIK